MSDFWWVLCAFSSDISSQPFSVCIWRCASRRSHLALRLNCQSFEAEKKQNPTKRDQFTRRRTICLLISRVSLVAYAAASTEYFTHMTYVLDATSSIDFEEFSLATLFLLLLLERKIFFLDNVQSFGVFDVIQPPECCMWECCLCEKFSQTIFRVSLNIHFILCPQDLE